MQHDKFGTRLSAANRNATGLAFLLVFYSFSSPGEATLSVLALLMHEGAHTFAAIAVSRRRGGRLTFRTVWNGFRLSSSRFLSYRDELTVLVAGPFSNLACCLLLLPFPTPILRTFAAVQLFTGLGNLIPVMGYDGYRTLELLLERGEKSTVALPYLSFSVSLFLCFVLLYAILRTNEGYFAFFLFLSENFRERCLFSAKSEEKRGKQRF